MIRHSFVFSLYSFFPSHIHPVELKKKMIMNLDFSKILLLVRFAVLLIGLVLCIAGASIELYRQEISFMGILVAKSEFYFISAQIGGNKLKYTDINGCDEMIIRMSVGLAVALIGIFASVIALVAVAIILAKLLQQLPQLLRIGALAASVSAFMGTMVSWAIIINTSKADFCNSGTRRRPLCFTYSK